MPVTIIVVKGLAVVAVLSLHGCEKKAMGMNFRAGQRRKTRRWRRAGFPSEGSDPDQGIVKHTNQSGFYTSEQIQTNEFSVCQAGSFHNNRLCC